jgi:hypothetical protein
VHQVETRLKMTLDSIPAPSTCWGKCKDQGSAFGYLLGSLAPGYLTLDRKRNLNSKITLKPDVVVHAWDLKISANEISSLRPRAEGMAQVIEPSKQNA